MDLSVFAFHFFLCFNVMVVESANSKFWIVAKKFDPANVSPLCGLNCVKPIGLNPVLLPNRSVGLHKCTFSPLRGDLQLWTYNSSSNAITISQWDEQQVRETNIFCLENRNITSCHAKIPFDPVSNYPTRLANCTGEKSQQWYLQEDGRIRSGLLSAKGEVLYLQGQSLLTEPGGHTPLCLGPANTGYSERHPYFTRVPFPTNETLYSSTVMAAAPSPGEGENLVSNGGFEDMAPGNTSVAPSGNITLSAGNPILCYWSIGRYAKTSDELSRVVVTTSWSNPGWNAKEGSNSLLMGGNGLTRDATVTQFVRTRPGGEYSLSFFLAGYPRSCQNKTLIVQLSPGSNYTALIIDELFVPFETANTSNTDLEWKQIALNFIAPTELMNLTFLNPMKAGTCAPVIDNVSIIKQEKQDQSKVAIAIAVPVTVIVVVASLVLFFILRKRLMSAARTMSVLSRSNEAHKHTDSSYSHIRTYAMWEVLQATDIFSNKVGQGGFGEVYRAHLENNVVGAVKRATRRGVQNPQIFKEELSVLLRLNHPNLVNLIGLCFEKGEQILVFEFIPNGSLYDRLHKYRENSSTPLSWSSRVNIALQIAMALQYLHLEAEPPVLHHDVKSANVLLVDDDHAKLADFGLSKLGYRDSQAAPTPVKGSYGYTDPQYIRTGKPTMKSDVYSFGVVLLEMITGRKAVQDFVTLAEWSEEYRLSQDMQTVMTIIDPTLIEEQIDLDELKLVIGILNACLNKNGENRPSMTRIVRAISYKSPIIAPTVKNDDPEEMVNTTCCPDQNESTSILYVGR